MFGEQVLSDTVFFAVPLSLYSYSYAYGMLTKRKFNIKMLLQPSVLAIILGLVVGISGIKMPNMISQVISTLDACMSPITMILTGIVISGYTARSLFGKRTIYVIVILRLIIIPCLLGLIIKLIYPPVLIPMLLCYSMPIGMNTIVYPRLVGENCEIGAGLVCVTTLLSCITIFYWCYYYCF